MIGLIIIGLIIAACAVFLPSLGSILNIVLGVIAAIFVVIWVVIPVIKWLFGKLFKGE